MYPEENFIDYHGQKLVEFEIEKNSTHFIVKYSDLQKKFYF